MVASKNYDVYIMTNKYKTTLYIGVTNSLERRVFEHKQGLVKGFTQKYNCHHLIYFEWFDDIDSAIFREKQIKKYRKDKKMALISSKNPSLEFLDDKIKGL